MRTSVLTPHAHRRTCPGPLLALLLVGILPLRAGAQGNEPGKGGTPSLDPGAVEVRFNDGGVLKLTLLEAQIEIMTPTGKKAVRLADLRKVELAPRLPDEEAKLIEAAIRGLGARTFKEREQASAFLLRKGRSAYPALLAASKSADAETRRRATAIIDVLKDTLPEEVFEAREADVVHTAEGKLSGKIVQDSWKASTTQFGVVQVKVADVAKAVSLAHPEPLVEKLVARPDPGTMTGFQGQIGKVFAFRVTGGLGGSVWGTGTYTSDSRLATAAIHAGVLQLGETKVIKVRVVAPLGAYVGSTQNGVTTSGYGPWSGSYEIIK